MRWANVEGVVWCEVLLFVAGLKSRWFGREGWEGQVIRWSKKEGGLGRVLWIEESGVHPRSGLEHGRSAQQELEMGEGGQGTPATYLFRRQSRHPLGGTYRVLRAQLARATRGRCQGSPGSVQ